MRADRLLSIMLLLQVHRRMTARELAQRLEVSERTIHRDMEALGAAGIPVTAERGTGGGWILLEEYRTNLTGLTVAEIQTLFLSKPPRLLSDLGLHEASEAALIKLFASLPVMRRRDAEYTRQRIHIDASGWHRPPEESILHLPTLQTAIWQERKLRFSYERGDDVVERLADPLGLVAKGNTWYLVAAVEGQVRNYRVSRIRDAEVLDEPCQRPPDFDLAEHWASSMTTFASTLPRYRVTVRIAEDQLHRIYLLSRFPHVTQNGPADADRHLTLQLEFENADQACGFLLAFGPDLVILDPPDLYTQLLQTAQRFLAAHDARTHTQG